MLHIHCAHCGTTLKGKDVEVRPFSVQKDGVKYKDYAVICKKCGGTVDWDRYAEKARENREKALAKKQPIAKTAPIKPIVCKPKKVFNASPITCSDRQVRDFYSAIIMRALKDHAKKKYKKSTEDFFASEHGKKICESVDLSADFILQRLKDGRIKVKEDDYDD